MTFTPTGAADSPSHCATAPRHSEPFGNRSVPKLVKRANIAFEFPEFFATKKTHGNEEMYSSSALLWCYASGNSSYRRGDTTTNRIMH